MSLFAILTHGRTGSTPLVAEINQHPDIVCHQEIFRPAPPVTSSDMVPAYEAVRQSGRTPTAEEYLREIEASAPAGQKVGFKLLMTHLDQHQDIGLERFLFDSRMPIIFLTRDPARAALSAAIAKERKVFNLPVDLIDDDHRARMKRPVRLKPSFVAREARQYAYWNEYWQNRLRETDTPHIVVTYEEYVEDPLVLLNRIFRFLDVAELPELAANPFVKVTSENVWDDVLNAGEVRKALSNHDEGAAPVCKSDADEARAPQPSHKAGALEGDKSSTAAERRPWWKSVLPRR